MSKRLQVLRRQGDDPAAALPFADVVGPRGGRGQARSLGPAALVVVRAGDPGEPDVDLSPLTYNYEHAIPLEVANPPPPPRRCWTRCWARSARRVAADRTLGGLCDFLEAGAPSTEDFDAVGAAAGRWADLQMVAAYATPDPLN
jgi:hypothetical protein